VERVVGASAFEAMKTSFEQINKERESVGKSVKANHIRQGKSGSWAEMFKGVLLTSFQEVEKVKACEFGLTEQFDYGSP